MAKLSIIGDVHAGKKFIEGVPLNRRGERELMVLSDLIERLNNFEPAEAAICVQVGDLFDTFKVDNETLLAVGNAFREAAVANPTVEYVVMRGNHDAVRETGRVSSFDLFKGLVQGLPNLQVVTEVSVMLIYGQRLGFLPWHPFDSALKLAQNLKKIEVNGPFDAVFCHCDLKSYGGDDFNVLPYEELAKMTETVYTGHVHTPSKFHQGLLWVTVTGSMQPYSHGEDPTEEFYVTVDYNAFILAPADLWKNKYVRVDVLEGQQIEEIPDCLGFSTRQKKVSDEEADAPEDMSATMDGFDSRATFVDCLTEAGVTPQFQQQVMEKFDASFAQD